MIKLGIAPINWSNDDLPTLGGHISFEQCIREMHEAGYQGCEVGNKFPRDPLVLQHALGPYRLAIASAWYSLFFTEEGREEETIQGFKTHLQFLKDMGATVIVVCECGHSIQGHAVSVLNHKPVFSPNQWQSLIMGLKQLAQLATSQQMTLVYHYHMGTGVQTQKEIDKLLAETSSDELSLVLDTGHAVYAGTDPLVIIQNHAKRIKHVHLKDIRAPILEMVKNDNLSFLDSVRHGVFTVPGDGMIDFKPIIEALQQHSYDGWYIVEAEQDPDKAHPLQYAILARRYLENLSLKTCRP